MSPPKPPVPGDRVVYRPVDRTSDKFHNVEAIVLAVEHVEAAFHVVMEIVYVPEGNDWPAVGMTPREIWDPERLKIITLNVPKFSTVDEAAEWLDSIAERTNRDHR